MLAILSWKKLGTVLMRFLPAILLGLAILVFALWLVSVVRDRDAKAAELIQANRDKADMALIIERQEQTASVHRIYVREANERDAYWQQLHNDFEQMEGRDAPLSDLMRASAERLWP